MTSSPHVSSPRPTRRRPPSAASRRLAGATLSIAMWVAVGGCSTLDPLDVTLVDLRITDVTVFETSAIITIRLANENRSALTVDGGVYNLYVDGKRIGKGLTDEVLELPRLGFATADVEIHLSNVALATRLRSVLEEKTFSYRIKGKAFVKGDLRPTSVKIDRGGVFELDEAPAELDLESGIGR